MIFFLYIWIVINYFTGSNNYYYASLVRAKSVIFCSFVLHSLYFLTYSFRLQSSGLDTFYSLALSSRKTIFNPHISSRILQKFSRSSIRVIASANSLGSIISVLLSYFYRWFSYSLISDFRVNFIWLKAKYYLVQLE